MLIRDMARARLVILLAIILLLNGMLGWQPRPGARAEGAAAGPSPDASTQSSSGSEDSYQYTLLFSRVIQLVRQNYFDPQKVGYKELTYAALRGMLSSLDPHSQFLDEEAFADLQRETKGGEFSGLGVIVGVKDGSTIIVAPMDDSPAGKAGLLPGDRILRINGLSTDKMSLVTVGNLLKGNVGEKAVLTILRPGRTGSADGNIFEATLTRSIIQLTSVKDAHLLGSTLAGPDKVGYVRIEEFGQRTPEEFDRAINDLESQGMQELVIDLRNNPGGVVDAAVQVAGQFVPPNSTIVSLKGRNPDDEEEFKTKATHERPGYPIAVLINGYSASAAEIVAGALKDLNRAILVGETSFGKGAVQTVQSLGNGVGIRLTTARYYTPSNRSIHEIGITPDLSVPITNLEEQRIILAQEKRALSPAEQKQAGQMVDRQLQRAVSALRSVKVYREKHGLMHAEGNAPTPDQH